MDHCEVVECENTVNKRGHTLCYDHWLENRDGLLSRCASCQRLKEGDKPLCYPCYKKKASGTSSADDGELLSATELGAHFGVSAQRLNLVLAELGWVNRELTKGWTPTSLGVRAGAVAREARQTGIPYVVWSPKVRSNKALLAALRGDEDAPISGFVESLLAGVLGSATPAAPAPRTTPDAAATPAAPGNFRDAHETPYRTQDGHRVRSRAELVIDDWLYHHRLVHAYERRLPVEENAVCDFWLPQGRVYIEYWGMEQNEAYAERKRTKKALYAKYEMNLIELGDEELKSLDDHLPRMLRKFNIPVD